MEDHFTALHRELIVDIMSRLEACTLAAAAYTCRDLSDAAKDNRLWAKLCRETWPSTTMIQIEESSKTEDPGFKSLYADAFPLILYEATRIAPRNMTGDATLSNPSDFTSLVDISYKGHSIFSKTVDGIAESSDGTCCKSLVNFMCYPFELELLGPGIPDAVQESGNKDDSIVNLPSSIFMGWDDREHDLRNNLAENMRLSWILLNKKKRKAVNISSWKPLSFDKNNPSHEDYTLYFGCAVATEDGIETQMSSEFVIMVKCKMMIRQECIRWKEISLVIKDIGGLHLNGEQSMRVIDQALVCSRSINHEKVDMGYQLFHKHKRSTERRNDQEELLANIIVAAIAIAALVGIGYACATLL